MKRTATLLASLALTLGLGVGLAPAASAEEDVALPLLPTTVMCVKTDFTVTGSGWKVQAGVAAWNEAQSVIRLTTTAEPGCSPTYVHHYRAPDDRCGYTAWERGHVDENGGWIIGGADVYLNDRCTGYGNFQSRWIVAHELGHAMGLPHIDSTRSVMRNEGAKSETRPLIGQVDARALAALYR